MSIIRGGCGIRPRVQGKFIFVGDEKLYVRGVTYGTFRLDEGGNENHDPGVVEQDFSLMAANGLNAIRTYTVPPIVLPTPRVVLSMFSFPTRRRNTFQAVTWLFVPLVFRR